MISLADRINRFGDPGDFFAKQGRYWMKLTREAGASVVEKCSDKALAVSTIEGGIWHDPGFEARLDAIWHSELDSYPEDQKIAPNNAEALQFLRSDMPTECDTVIVSTFERKS